MATVAVDIDGTLYDFEGPFRQAFLDLALENDNKEEYFRGGYQSWVEWRSPSDVCGPEAFEKALERVHSDPVILSRAPFDHAVEVLEEVWSEGHEIIYISNRAEKTRAGTWLWLERCGFPKGDLVCTMEPKKKFIGECQYLIDDRPKTQVEFLYDYDWRRDADPQHVRKAFSLLFNYNRAMTDIPNLWLAPTWYGLRFYLTREGVINAG